MAENYTIHVEHEGESYHAGVRAEDEADQLLVKSLHHFELDPQRKDDWLLVREGGREGEQDRLVLRDSVAAQLENGDRVRLLPRDNEVREPSTGSY